MEVNCACMGFDGECTVSLCEQPVSWEDYLTFEDKYTRNAGKGMKSLSRRIPAPIGDEMTRRIQAFTAEIFRTLECKGIVRIDYLIDASETSPTSAKSTLFQARWHFTCLNRLEYPSGSLWIGLWSMRTRHWRRNTHPLLHMTLRYSIRPKRAKKP